MDITYETNGTTPSRIRFPKVAVCLAGIPRSIEYSLPLLKKNIISPLDADVFIHTWDINTINNDKVNITYPFNDAKSQLEWFNRNINPTLLKVDPCSVKSPMFYSVRESILSALRHCDYDLIVRCRMDCFFDEPIPLNEIIECIVTDYRVFVRFSGIDVHPYEKRMNFTYDDGITPYVADNFAFGSPLAMEAYSHAYDYSIGNNNPPETHLASALLSRGILPKFSTIKFDTFKGIENGRVISFNYYNGRKETIRYDLHSA